MTTDSLSSHNMMSTPLLTSMRKNLFASSWYQLLFLSLFIGLPYGLLALQIDTVQIFTLPINVGNIWILWIIGYIGLGLLILQWIYVAILPKINGTPKALLLGRFIGIFMLFFLPTGTFFGVLLLLNLKNQSQKQVAAEKLADYHQMMGKNIAMSGILMLNLPMILLCLQFYFLTLQIDMLYPILSTTVLIGWEIFCYIYIGIYSAQFLMGFIYPRFASRSWMRGIIWFFVGFQILALGIVLDAFFIYLVPYSAELDDFGAFMPYVPYFGWLLGVLLNPLGVYFGGMMGKALKLEHTSDTSK